jgi:hypothetical protein
MKIGSLVKHIPTGYIVKVKSKGKIFIHGEFRDKYGEWTPVDNTKVRISECEPYTPIPKEKSAYDKMRERNMEDAKKLSTAPKEVGQHILWLKMAVIDRVEKIENLIDDKIYTFKKKENGEEYSKFGFSEHYVNLLMHYAYEAGKNNENDRLTKFFTENTNSMKHAISEIVNALDTNGFLPDYND